MGNNTCEGFGHSTLSGKILSSIYDKHREDATLTRLDSSQRGRQKGGKLEKDALLPRLG